MLRMWISAVVGLAAFGLASCEGKLPGLSNGPAAGAGAASAAQPAAKVDIGGPLFDVVEPPRQPKAAATGTAQGDPIVIHGAQLTVPVTENVPTKNNGKLWHICTEVSPGQPVAEADVFVHPMVKDKRYRRLREGDVVQKGQLVALLDDQVARAKYNAAVTDKSAADKKLEASVVVADKAKKTYEVYANTPNISSKIERYKAEQEWAAAEKAAAESVGERDKAIEALNIAKTQLEEHELRATNGGVIKTIYRKPGESVKELEPVLQVQNLDMLRAEGSLPVQYLPLLPNPRGKVAFLEPSSQLAPQQELPGHWAAVTGVAVSKDPRKALIVSVSEDKTLRVWDRMTKFQKFSHSLDVPIRAVACTAPNSQFNVALFGGDDGVGQLLDLDRLGEGDAIAKLKDTLRGRVNAVAFSPDAKYCAVADDKEVVLFETASREKKYRFAANHRGPITAVQFTPQSRLVTVARDKTVRVWDLGEKGAKLNGVIDNRSGNVDVLGVSPDGQRIIFDQERALHVRHMFEQRTDAVMPSATDSSQFTGFATFSPDSTFVVAAGTADNPLGIWKMPQPGSTRAYQRVRLAVGHSTPTCAAFAPDGSFLVVGTADARLLVFAKPERADLEKQYQATITFVDQSVESTDRKVRLWAELANPGMPLLPGDTVTMIIPQQ